MRITFYFILASLASVGLAAEPQIATATGLGGQETTEDAPSEPAEDEPAVAEDEEGEPVDEDAAAEEAKLLAELEAAAQKEREREAKIIAEREAAKGEEHETLTTAKGRTYKGVTIRGVDDLGVRIMHQAGTARIKFAECPIELQERFGYDPNAAQEQLKEEREREAERLRRTIARLRAESGEAPLKTERRIPTTTARTTPKTEPERTEPADVEPLEESPEPDLGGDEEGLDIPTLQRRIAQLEASIEQIRKVGESYEAQAEKIEDRLFANVGGTGEPKLDPAKMAKIKEWRDKADVEFDKVAKARRTISKYRREIKKLERDK